MRTATLSTVCLAAIVATAFVVVRAYQQLHPSGTGISLEGGGAEVGLPAQTSRHEPLLEPSPLPSRNKASGLDPEKVPSGTEGPQQSPTPSTAELESCPSCQALKDEIVSLKIALAKAEERANELALAAMQVAYAEGTPIGDAIRQEEFRSLSCASQRTFVEMMEGHFPIFLSQSEVAWIASGLGGTGDPQFSNNAVRACIYFLGPRRILDDVARSQHPSQTRKFDKEYVDSLARGN